MLPPPNRLPKQNISDILRHGTRAATEEIDLRYKKTSSALRFAFVVSTKVDKRATQRNRIRRILSESVQHALPRLMGVDAVFLVRKNIAGLSQQTAEQRVTDLFSSAGLL